MKSIKSSFIAIFDHNEKPALLTLYKAIEIQFFSEILSIQNCSQVQSIESQFKMSYEQMFTEMEKFCLALQKPQK